MKRDRVSEIGAVMLGDPEGRHYGYDLSRASGVRPAAMYRVLARMLAAGWVVDGWDVDELDSAPGFPRRFYRLTPEGRDMLAGLVAVNP